MEPRKLLIIDLSALFWRAWHASAAKPVNEAIQRVLEVVRKFASAFEHIAIALDAPPYKRRELFPDYKANRPETDEGARSQLRDMIATLDSEGYPLWSVPGYEADDVIASAVERALAMDDPPEVVILSEDKDLCQVVREGVCLMCNAGTVGRREQVIAKWGVEPEQMDALLALMGDKIDNVPGVRGIGKETAPKLLKEHKSLAGLELASLDGKIAGKVGEALAAAIADGSLMLSHKLVFLVRDLPVDISKAFEPRVMKPKAKTEWGGPKPEPKPAPVVALAPPAPEPPPPAAMVLSTRSPEFTLALEPRDPQEAYVTAGHLASSRLFGGLSTQDQIFTAILLGRSRGVDSVTMARGCHVIEGRLALSAQMIVALVLKSGKARYFVVVNSTDEEAVYETHRHGDPRPVTFNFTIKDAQRARLGQKDGSNWQKYPRTMLRWRCATELARAVYPDVTMGLYSPDELSSGTSDIIDAEIEPERAA